MQSKVIDLQVNYHIREINRLTVMLLFMDPIFNDFCVLILEIKFKNYVKDSLSLMLPCLCFNRLYKTT